MYDLQDVARLRDVRRKKHYEVIDVRERGSDE